MLNDIFLQLDPWVLGLLSIGVLLACAEIGFRWGRRASRHVSVELHPHVSTIESALLGLLALLLGFAFAMAMNRYDTRKQLVIEEANDIETAWLRTRLLPERYREEVAGLLEQYLDSRIAYYRAGVSPRETRQALNQTQALQVRLWDRAVEAAHENSDLVTSGYFIESLNNLIDDHSKRLSAMENHVPESILHLLLLVAGLTITVTGYSSGLKNARLGAVRLILVVLVAATLFIVVDLDRPRRGLITVSERNLIDVQQALQVFKGIPASN